MTERSGEPWKKWLGGGVTLVIALIGWLCARSFSATEPAPATPPSFVREPPPVVTRAEAPAEPAAPFASGAPVDMDLLLVEAKSIEAARSALAAGNAKKALEELDLYFKIPNARSFRQEATLLEIEALAQVGRRKEAKALAYSTRDDPTFEDYRPRIETLTNGI